MTTWRPQSYRAQGRAKASPEVLARAIETAALISSANQHVEPIFTLRHLSHLTGVGYGHLRRTVSREGNDYTIFRIRKRTKRRKKPGFRLICAPAAYLLRVQRWIVHNVLIHGSAHPASVAYSPGSSIASAASAHVNARWLIKLDIVSFFESVDEISIFRVFRAFGYQPLIAFEMARICTRQGTLTRRRRRARWRCHARPRIQAYTAMFTGHLPQGAPTSPMLANFAMRDFDQEVSRVCDAHELIYTRYADDIAISTSSHDWSRSKCTSVIREIYQIMRRFGFSPNTSKAQIVPPGARKVVLGLLVDGPSPRLSRQFRSTLRAHLYYLARTDIGPAGHAKARGFASIAGLKHHVLGLIAYAQQIDTSYGDRCRKAFDAVPWPV